MGNLNVKLGENGEDLNKSELEISIGEVDLEDPRSPTPDINRTPIQTLDSSKLHKITKNIDLSKECFEKCDKNVLTNPSLRAIMSQIDPRSPTIDFQRTPLSVLLKNPELIAKYNQMNTSTNLNSSITDAEESMPTPRPLNLDTLLADLSIEPTDNVENEVNEDVNFGVLSASNSSNVITQKINSNNGRIPGLLETNLDYLETDLDTVKRKKKFTQVKTVLDDQDLDTSPEIEKNHSTEKTVTNKIKIKDLSDKDPRSPSLGIDRTPIILLEDKQQPERAEIHTKMQEIFDNNMKLQQKRIDDKVLDSNSEFLLIYEDNLENKVGTPVKKTMSNQKTETSRTPLACMMNTHQSKSNTPIKSHVISKKSKIPIKVKPEHCFMDSNLKIQNFSRKNIPIDSIENTPPKPRLARWDQDNSVLL